MALDRIDRTSLSLAVAGHVVLFAALSVHLFAKPARSFDNPPMEVDLIAETALASAAPELSAAPPAARLAAEEGPVEDAIMATSDPSPQPLIEPAPSPRVNRPTPPPKPAPKASAKPAPPARAKPAPTPAPSAAKTRRPTGNLKGLLDGIGKDASASKSNAAPAQSVGEIRRSISVSINAEVRGPWNRCSVSGIDVDELKTTIVFRLSKSGALAGFDRVSTSGETPSNAAQVNRFEECAKRAIQLAAPFDLPAENYDYWKTYTLDFEKR
ncbi:MAG: hypothetical protein GW859_08715 [Sphingomonadales bacterium]|nr:hypothetical protein [Sphingomonadales bacterium]